MNDILEWLGGWVWFYNPTIPGHLLNFWLLCTGINLTIFVIAPKIRQLELDFDDGGDIAKYVFFILICSAFGPVVLGLGLIGAVIVLASIGLTEFYGTGETRVRDARRRAERDRQLTAAVERQTSTQVQIASGRDR